MENMMQNLSLWNEKSNLICANLLAQTISMLLNVPSELKIAA